MPLLTEMPWLAVDMTIPTITGRIVSIDRIDPRLEDLRTYGHFKIHDYYQWLARFPHHPDKYLTSDYGIITSDKAEQLDWQLLPPDWWEYALGLLDDKIVKAPKHLRPGEPTQREIDSGIAESYQWRLTQVLLGHLWPLQK